MKVTAEFRHQKEFEAFVRKLSDPIVMKAATMGLNDHAHEQRRQSVVRISAYTGVPRGRVADSTKVIRASGIGTQAIVRTSGPSISLAEYGNPVWVRDLNPMADGKRGGSVSSMKGAEATGWNVRRQFKGTFTAGGQVVVRVSKSDPKKLKRLSMAVLANELSKPTRPNVSAAERYVAVDLEKRVLRQVIRALGT